MENDNYPKPNHRSLNKYMIRLSQRIHNVVKTRRSYRRKEFHKKKEQLGLPYSDFVKMPELERQLKGNDIIAALELAARYQHYTVKEFDWYFAPCPHKNALQIMEALIPEVEEYLENHNTERFGFCPMKDGNPIKEELADLYIDNIDTYKKVVRYTRDVMVIENSEFAAWVATLPDSESD